MVRRGKSKKRTDGNEDVPRIFKEMLADTMTHLPVRTDNEGRTVKRRRVGGQVVTKVAEPEAEDAHQWIAQANDDSQMSDLFEEPLPKRPQVVRTDSEDSAGSDMDWEEVDLQRHDAENQDPDLQGSEIEKLNLVLGPNDNQVTQTPRGIKRKSMTRVEKTLRLNIHKMHLCCVLTHVFIRNYWCEDEAIHKILRGILSKKSISYLNPSEEKSQFQRSRSFMDGLEQASESFRNRFEIVARGMSRPAWAESPEALARSQPPKDIDLPMQKADFRSAAQDLKASRDVGAQLFCALLRSAGVDARLVCSLQTLPFNASTLAIAKPRMSYAAYYSAEEQERKVISEEDSDSVSEGERDLKSKAAIGSIGGRTRFKSIGEGALDVQSTESPVHLKGRIRESKYPVYWVEAFNEATQKWVPIDPLVTKTIAKPSKLEPPAGDRENNLTYAIAFEDDGSAHDVTRRYAKAYNAKTRRDRVDSTKGGDRWWKRVMRTYRRRHSLDRDQIDDAELAKKEAAEPMPRNVQDFKDHPYYALERHLRRHEVIYPRREVGKVSTGKSGGSAVLEPIYRRRDIHNVQSGDKWYRSMGREIKPGEQPLKRVQARRNREQSADLDEQDEENAGTALYAIHQTTLYKAPPIVNGRVPKNAYGNLDIYVPSMIPPGGIHIEHPETVRVARILGIDFAEAVTGFVFKGRHGSAVMKGAVIASEHRQAVEVTISVFEDERLQAEGERRSHEAMRMWKRFLAGLRSRKRIEGYDIEGERQAVKEVRDEMDKAEDEDDDEGGGFFPGQEVGDIAEPTAGRAFEKQDVEDQERHSGFMFDDAVNRGYDKKERASDWFIDNTGDDAGGGFLIEDDHDEDAQQALQESVEDNGPTQDPRPLFVQRHMQSMLDTAKPFNQEPIDSAVNKQPVKGTSNADEAEQGFAPRLTRLTNELTQEELDEACLLQELHEEEQKPSLKLSQETFSTSIGATRQDSETLSNVKEAHPTSPKSPSIKAVSQLETPMSDKGSLLSEDPEDEDAEPDWLV